MISIATEENQDYVPITQFGDGFNKIFRYIVEIMYVKNIFYEKHLIEKSELNIIVI